MTEQLESTEIADALHDVMVRELARLAPTGSDRTVPLTAFCDALVYLMAGFLVAAQGSLPADEVERLTLLFRQRLEQEIADRGGGPVGHA